MKYDDAVALQGLLSRRNPGATYEIAEHWSCLDVTYYVRVVGREPKPRRPRSKGPERAVAERGHRQLDREFEQAVADGKELTAARQLALSEELAAYGIR